MAHQIHNANAVYAAADGVGWHGIGKVIPAAIAKDPRKIAELCGGTYSVEKRSFFYPGKNGQMIEARGKEVIVRTDTDRMLSVVSDNKYHVDNRQPIDIFEAFRDQLAAESLMISHACVLRGGAQIAVSARLPDDCSFNVGGPKSKDRVDTYTTLFSGYDLKSGTDKLVSFIRVVCANTLQAAMLDAEQKGNRTRITASMRMQAGTLQNLLDGAFDQAATEKARYDEFANAKLKDADVQRYFADVLQINVADLNRVDEKGKKLVSTRSQNILRELANSYSNAPGAKMASGTVWGVLNAVTHYATHLKGVHDNGEGKDAARVASNLNGDAAKLKMRALELAANMVKVAA